MTIIIGIDPGSRKTGYGIIKVEAKGSRYLTSGHLALKGDQLAERLQQLFTGLRELVDQYQPDEAAIEQVFVQENVNSALKLGQARGAAIVAVNRPIAEYSPRTIKQAITGYGNAAKEQIQVMVQRLLNINTKLQPDEADALAVALCHAHSRVLLVMNKLPRAKVPKTIPLD